MMYEQHWGSDFRDLLNSGSSEWDETTMPEKIVDLRAFESAGVSVEELIVHYRETMTRQPDTAGLLENLQVTMRYYAEAGYRPRLPADIEAAVGNAGYAPGSGDANDMADPHT
jgi:hypothetical protein